MIRPAHVRLLDYEVEIGLVIGREMPVGTTITEDNLADYVAGLVVTNDISARDVQLPKTQFYEAKSYPTFTPVGPALVLLDADELKRFTDLRLRLWVNGELRQNMTVADMIYQPVQTLQALTRFQRLDPGDLLLTGTPVGTALSAPPKPVADPRLAAAARGQVEALLRGPGPQPQVPAGRRRRRGHRGHRRRRHRPGPQRTVVRYAR